MATIRNGSGLRLGKRWAVLPLITILCLALFSTTASAGWVGCIRARLDGENAVRLLATADENGTMTFTIDRNVITFAASANVELDTGKLRIDKAVSVVAELSDAAGAVTARCTIPIEEITGQYKDFCCDREGPAVWAVVDPQPCQGGWFNRPISIHVTAEDESGIAEIAYQSPIILDGNVVRIEADRLDLSDSGRSAEWRVELYPQYTPSGCHEVECWATDASGNVSERVGIELQFDFDAPRIGFSTAPTSDGTLITWEVTDALSDVYECRVVAVSNSVEHVLSTSSTGNHTLTAGEVGAGEHEIRIRAIDQAGNETLDRWTITLDQPLCTIRGVVVDGATLEPLPGVTVTLYETEAVLMTDRQGEFSFTVLDPSSYTIEFTKPGYALNRVGGGDPSAFLIELPSVLLDPMEIESPDAALPGMLLLCNPEVESNEDLGSANWICDLPGDGCRSGYIEGADDIDMYVFDVFHLCDVTIQTFDCGDTTLALLDSAGDLIAYNDDGPVDTSSVITQNLSAGRYYIRIEAYSNESFSYSVSIEGVEVPEITYPSTCWYEVEPNDCADLADVLSDVPGNGCRVGSIDPSTDEDWYIVNVSSTAHVTVETETMEGDTYLQLYDSSGDLIDCDDDSGMGLASKIERLLSPGTYYVRVTAYGTGAIDGYSVVVISW